uniref:Uncharacterized protein n=1 Tax=viral metagenome TaxID=1070528 RepID=A0A6M3M6R5_9ZZZZ
MLVLVLTGLTGRMSRADGPDGPEPGGVPDAADDRVARCILEFARPEGLRVEAECFPGVWLPFPAYDALQADADRGRDCPADLDDVREQERARCARDLAVERLKTAAWEDEAKEARGPGPMGLLLRGLGAVGAGAGLGALGGLGAAGLTQLDWAEGAAVGAVVGTVVSALAVLVYEVIR